MNHFNYQGNKLFCESVPVEAIAAEVGTPFYLYSTATLSHHFKTFDSSFAGLQHLTCFAVKSCSNLAILRLFAKLGSGADIVSGGELFRCLEAGIPAKKIIYSGVGKTEEEMRAGLQAGILLFNVESEQELDVMQAVASRLGIRAPVAFRVNPDVDPKTHAYISTGLAKNKFGIPIAEAMSTYQRAKSMPNIEVMGISCHIGSQLTEVSPFIDSLLKIRAFIERLSKQGICISYLDLGGGLGVRYQDEEPPHPTEYAAAIMEEMGETGCILILEPGRVIVGNAGILVSRVLYTKKSQTKNFVIVDAGMNDLARPSLYKAFHDIVPVEREAASSTESPRVTADVVGPICETGDFLAQDRELPVFNAGDLIAVMSSGAYGFSMSSNYNSRPRVPEVLVNGGDFFVIRERETHETLIQGESIPEFLL